MDTELGSTNPACSRNWRTSLVSFRPLSTRSPKACSTDFIRSSRCWRRRRASVSSPEPTPMLAMSSSWASVPLLALLWSSSIVSETTASAVRRAMTSSMEPSDLDVDDLQDPEEAGELHHERDGDQHLADRVREQHRHVLRVDRVEQSEQHEREQCQQVAGHPALRGVDLNLAANG